MPSRKEHITAHRVEDFEALLNEYDAPKKSTQALRLGAKVRGSIIMLSSEYAYVALGAGQEGAVARADLPNESPNIGDELDLYVVQTGDELILSTRLSSKGGKVDLSALESALTSGLAVEGKITGANKGGFEILVGKIKAFCPISQIDNRFVENTEDYVGQTLSFLVTEIKGSRNVVLSRRKLLQAEAATQRQATLESLAVGKTVDGTVARIADFGAFVNLGGIDGLIPRSEISYGHVDKVEDVLSVGDRVSVEILSIDNDGEKTKIGLSLRRAKGDPLKQNKHLLLTDEPMDGKVTRLESFGAFVELFEGVEGLVHISEISHRRIAHPKEELEVGNTVTVKVLDVDEDKRRISLSIKNAIQGEEGGIRVGATFKGKVVRHESYGVFIQDENETQVLIPKAESNTPQGSELRNHFKVGSEVEVEIISIDDKGRMRGSIKALLTRDEREAVRSYKNQNTRSMGTLGDLLKDIKL